MLLFLKVLFTEFIAEMGDKTQLMLIAMTSKFKTRDIILGTAVANLVLNALAVLAGGLIGSLVPMWLIKLVAAAAFLYFAISVLGGEDDEEEEAAAKGHFRFAPLTVFLTFFAAELGDKTQLTAMTFGANEGLSNALVVWLACSIGLFAADILGMMAGYLLKSKLSDRLMHTASFVIFAVFGLLTLHTGLSLLPGVSSVAAILVTLVVAAAFAALCGLRLKEALI